MNIINTMTYRGYSARIEYSDEDGCFIGHLSGISDVIGFHGESVTELRAAFEEAVEDYFETCKKLNRLPQTPHSENLTLHIPPQIHTAITTEARISGKSVNQWAVDTFANAVYQPSAP